IRSPALAACGLPPRENSHSPDKIWTTADCVEVCSLSSWPSANPNRTTREFGVRSSVRLTMPFAANLVSAASDRIFSCATSINGFSLMGKVSHGVDWRELTQVKHGSDSCFDDGGRVNAKNGINCANTSSSVRIREANTVQYRKLEGTMPRL